MRTLAKTVTWRIVGSSATFTIAYLLTGELFISSSIAITQMAVNTVLYYIHETIWNKIKWNS